MKGIVIGTFSTEDAILAAVRAAHQKGLPIHDVYTPYPVHGMDQAMGLRKSHLPKVCFGFGFAGMSGALLFQYWVSLFNWPMNIGGKSFDASPALIPIAFELTVLCAGLGTAAALFKVRNLWPGKAPAAEGLGATDDKFLLALAARSQGPTAGELKAFLDERGAEMTVLEDRA